MVKRYQVYSESMGDVGHEEADFGDWVKLEDALQLEQRIRELEKALRKIGAEDSTAIEMQGTANLVLAEEKGNE